MNRLLLCAPTAPWKAIERCLALLVAATLLVAAASSAFAAAGRVVTIQGRVRVLVPQMSGVSASVVRSANSPWPWRGGDNAALLSPPRRPRASSGVFDLCPGALEPVASITSAAQSVWGSARSSLRSRQQAKFKVPALKPE